MRVWKEGKVPECVNLVKYAPEIPFLCETAVRKEDFGLIAEACARKRTWSVGWADGAKSETTREEGRSKGAGIGLELRRTERVMRVRHDDSSHLRPSLVLSPLHLPLASLDLRQFSLLPLRNCHTDDSNLARLHQILLEGVVVRRRDEPVVSRIRDSGGEMLEAGGKAVHRRDVFWLDGGDRVEVASVEVGKGGEDAFRAENRLAVREVLMGRRDVESSAL